MQAVAAAAAVGGWQWQEMRTAVDLHAVLAEVSLTES
jgi:hypothetical protein